MNSTPVFPSSENKFVLIRGQNVQNNAMINAAITFIAKTSALNSTTTVSLFLGMQRASISETSAIKFAERIAKQNGPTV